MRKKSRNRCKDTQSVTFLVWLTVLKNDNNSGIRNYSDLDNQCAEFTTELVMLFFTLRVMDPERGIAAFPQF